MASLEMNPPAAKMTPPRRGWPAAFVGPYLHSDNLSRVDDQCFSPGAGHHRAELAATAAPRRSMRNPPAESIHRGLCPRGTGTAISSKG